MSFTSGTFSSVTSPAVSSEAAIAGNAEFFAPLILTRPLRRGPPVILSLSIFPLSGLAGLPVKNQFPGHECLHDPESPVQNRNVRICAGLEHAFPFEFKRFARIKRQPENGFLNRPVCPIDKVPKRNILSERASGKPAFSITTDAVDNIHRIGP